MPTFGRDEELQWLRTHALEGRAVLVTGAAGVGRTHLLGALAEQLARAGAPVGRISGGDGASAVPFAPFAPLVVEHLPHPAGQQVPDLEVFGRLPGRLVATGHVLVIDDLHLLDTASQILVAHLARAGLTLVASAPGRGTLPSALPACSNATFPMKPENGGIPPRFRAGTRNTMPRTGLAAASPPRRRSEDEPACRSISPTTRKRVVWTMMW